MPPSPRAIPIDALYRCLCPLLARPLPLRRKSPFARLPAIRQIRITRTPTPLSSLLPLASPLARDATASAPAVMQPDWPVLTGMPLLRELASRRQFAALFTEAHTLVARGELRADLALYQLLIEACASFGGPHLQNLAFTLLSEMKSVGVAPNAQVYHALLKLLAGSPDYLRRAQVLEEMRARWFDLGEEGWRWVLCGTMVDGRLEQALDMVQERMEAGGVVGRDVVEELVRRLLRLGEAGEALRIVRALESEELMEDNQHVSPAIWYALLEASAKELHLAGTLYAWYHAVQTPYPLFTPSNGLCNLVLHVAAHHGAPSLADSAFRFLTEPARLLSPPQEHHYAARLAAYARAGDLRRAFALLGEMEARKVAPTPHTADVLVELVAGTLRRGVQGRGQAEAGGERVQEARELLQGMKERGEIVTLAAANAVVAAACVAVPSSSPSSASALNLPSQDQSPDQASETLDPATASANLDTAFSIYAHDLPSLALRPNTHTFNALFRGCVAARRRGLAMYLVQEMRHMNVWPDRRTFAWLVDVCCVALPGEGGVGVGAGGSAAGAPPPSTNATSSSLPSPHHAATSETESLPSHIYPLASASSSAFSPDHNPGYHPDSAADFSPDFPPYPHPDSPPPHNHNHHEEHWTDAFLYLEEMKAAGFRPRRHTYERLFWRCVVADDALRARAVVEEMAREGMETKGFEVTLRKWGGG